MQNVTLSPEQCRAGRALLGWSQDRLAKAAKVARKTLADFEGGKSTPYERTLADVVRALETAGVEFIPEGPYQGDGGVGARLRRTDAASPAS